LQKERVAAFSEYIADVRKGRFPERCHLVEMESQDLDKLVRSIPSHNTATGEANP
jgi:3-methyl-2-oxobutanoate hydroxymethyltransferase